MYLQQSELSQRRMNNIAQASKWQQRGFELRLPSYAWESGILPPS